MFRLSSSWYTSLSGLLLCITAALGALSSCGVESDSSTDKAEPAQIRTAERNPDPVVRPRAPRAAALLAPGIVPVNDSTPALYRLQQGGMTAFFEKGGLSLALVGQTQAAPQTGSLSAARPMSTWGMRWRLADAAARSPKAMDEIQTCTPHLLHLANQPQPTAKPRFARLEYKAVRAGVDLMFESHARGLEYSLLIAPGQAGDEQRFVYEGAQALRITDDGRGLEVQTALGVLSERDLAAFAIDPANGRRPLVARYQDVRKESQPDQWSYAIRVEGRRPFEALLIDPMISWSSYHGGSGSDRIGAMTRDANDNLYLVGTTNSADYPDTAGFQGDLNGSSDAFVSKIAADGSSVIWATYLGGSDSEWGAGIALDGSGNVVVVGTTESADFPTTPGAYSRNRGFPQDVFVTKIAADGSAILWSSYLGGTGGEDIGVDVALDSNDLVYITGETECANFPIVSGVDSTLGGDRDAFVAKMAADGSSLVWSTFLGGDNGHDFANGMTVDAAGDVYVVGESFASDFPAPITFGARRDRIDPAIYDFAYVTKYESSGASVLWSVAIGGGLPAGGGADAARDVALDSVGNVVITGFTDSDRFPTTAGVFRETVDRAGGEVFVTKLSQAGPSMIWSTYLGGNSYDGANAVALDDQDNLYVVGTTMSTTFPTYKGFDTRLGAYSNGIDGFVTKINPTATEILWSSFLGGGLPAGVSMENAEDVVVDSNGNPYVVGTTAATDFPVLDGFQMTLAGGSDVFIAHIVPVADGTPCDDNDPCTQTDVYTYELCAGTPFTCDDSDVCTDDVCDGSGGCTFPDNTTACDDGDACTHTDLCDQGACAGTSYSCDDSEVCTQDSCDGAGNCSYTAADVACDDSDACTHSDYCDLGSCVGTALVCDDGAWCNGAETCDSGTGCMPGTAPDCDDAIACTVDSCDEGADACAYAADHAVCDNSLFCDGAESCDLATGCLAGGGDPCAAPTVCDEANDICTGCTEDAHCDDGLACTVDTCVAGACVQSPDDGVCDDGAWCNGAETCDAAQGCLVGAAPNCDDGLACTADSCDEGTDLCVAAPDDGLCDDGAWCNGPESCDAVVGCAVGMPPACDDGVACTVDSCDEGTDQCIVAPDDGLCDDGAWCNGAESCDGVQGCLAGTPPACDDSVGCTDDSCDEAADACSYAPNHAVCDNGLFCDGAESCDSLSGCLTGTGDPCNPPTVCDEGSDSCSGCTEDAHCDDGLACTIDSCQADVCVRTPDHVACDDGLFCNGSETCDAGQGCEAGGLPCGPQESCDEETDACVGDNNPPGVPTPLNPAHLSDIEEPMPELSVQNTSDPDGDALTYQFQVLILNTDAVLWEIADVAEGISLTSVQMDAPLALGTYEWRARAQDENGLVGDWSPRALFNVIKTGSSSGCGCAATGGSRSGLLGLLTICALALLRGRKRSR